MIKTSDWQTKDEVMTRTFEFKDFNEAMVFVNKVAIIAEKNQHHPDMDIRYNKVSLTLTTHDAGKLTEKDQVVAREINDLLTL